MIGLVFIQILVHLFGDRIAVLLNDLRRNLGVDSLNVVWWTNLLALILLLNLRPLVGELLIGSIVHLLDFLSLDLGL